MPSRFSGLFDTYDFFGKAIPGVVLMIGFASLLPQNSSLLILPEGANLRNIAILIIAGAAVGLIFGEGIHNLSINIERAFGWLKKWIFETKYVTTKFITSTGRFLQYLLLPPSEEKDGEAEEDRVAEEDGEVEEDGEEREKSEINTDSICGRLLTRIYRSSADSDFEPYFPPNVAIQIRNWIRRRGEEINVGLLPHRRLFETKLETQLSQYQSPKDEEDYAVAYQRLLSSVQSAYDYNLRKEVERLDEFYTVVRARVERDTDSRRANVFQSLYSFCRSMWVILATFSITYAALFIHEFHLGLRNSVSQFPIFLINHSHSFWLQAIYSLGIAISLGAIVIRTLDDSVLSGEGSVLLYFFGGAVVLIPEVPEFISEVVGEAAAVIANLVIDSALLIVEAFSVVFQSEIDPTTLVLFDTLNGLEAPFILLTFVSTIVFFDASGDYKEHYVEYLITEFAEIEGESDSAKDFKIVDHREQEESTKSSQRIREKKQ